MHGLQEREQAEEIERSKPLGTAVGSYLEYRCVASAHGMLAHFSQLSQGLRHRCVVWSRKSAVDQGLLPLGEQHACCGLAPTCSTDFDTCAAAKPRSVCQSRWTGEP